MAAGERFPHLLSPARIGALEVRNRVVMAPMMVGFAELDGRFSRRHVDYFAARAAGGAGLVITGSAIVESAIQEVPPGLPIARCDSDAHLPSLGALARAVHRHGAKIGLQVSPGQGRQSHFALAGKPPAAPSVVPAALNPEVLCRELRLDEIRTLVRACGEGAMRGVLAGFDMIDVHAHTGYLIDQFMTPLWNRRRDEYGGGFEGRMRFPLEIVRAIRERVGARVPIGFRLTAEHGLEGGRTLDEAREIARRLAAAGVDLFTVDAGCYGVEEWMNPPVYLGEGCQVDLAAAIREAVDVPVAAVGNITRPELAEAILAAGRADFIGLGRSLLADPLWVEKARQGRSGDIRPCIMCNEYCLGRMPAACAVNPQLGRERELAITPAPRRRSVLVVGGGPAGMEAARVAALRGHDVTLVERAGKLGGQLNPGGEPEYKRCLHALRDSLIAELGTAGVRVRLSCEADAALVGALSPDVVLIATGATPEASSVPSAAGARPIDVFELHGGGAGDVGDDVVILGGGPNGCDAAVDLARRGKKVTIVDRHGELARGMNAISRAALVEELEELGVDLVTDHEIREIAPGGVTALDRDGRRRLVRGDGVIVALGVEPCRSLADALRETAAEVRMIGDCVSPRKIGEAIHEGFGAAMRL